MPALHLTELLRDVPPDGLLPHLRTGLRRTATRLLRADTLQREHRAKRLAILARGDDREPPSDGSPTPNADGSLAISLDAPLIVDLSRRLRAKTKPPLPVAAHVPQAASLDPRAGEAPISYLPTPPESFSIDVDNLGLTDVDYIALLGADEDVADTLIPEEDEDIYAWGHWG